MRVTKFTYDLHPDGTHTKTEAIIDDDSPLAKAVEKEADANPGRIIMGAEVNGEIKFVGPLE